MAFVVGNENSCHMFNTFFLRNHDFRFLEALNHFEKARTLICRLPGVLTWPTSNVVIEETQPGKIKVTISVESFLLTRKAHLHCLTKISEDRGRSAVLLAPHMCFPLRTSENY